VRRIVEHQIFHSISTFTRSGDLREQAVNHLAPVVNVNFFPAVQISKPPQGYLYFVWARRYQPPKQRFFIPLGG